MSEASNACLPLSLTRRIEDFPIGNLPLHMHHEILCRASSDVLSILSNAWLDSKDAALLMVDSRIRTLVDREGLVLAWLGESPDLSCSAEAIASFVIRYPWDLLKANEQFIAALPHIAEFPIIAALIAPIDKGEVHPSAVVDGTIHLGSGSRILPGVFIEGNVIIGANCKIGPNCYLRGNSSIGDGCHIGQSVEIKNCLIMSKTNVGHLSYVGDSVLGENVNFGAGTIVSNLRHDGKNHRSMANGELIDTGRRKFGTIVGDGVHTGIHTSIYPGRKLWPGTTTLPGEIVRKDLISNI